MTKKDFGGSGGGACGVCVCDVGGSCLALQQMVEHAKCQLHPARRCRPIVVDRWLRHRLTKKERILFKPSDKSHQLNLTSPRSPVHHRQPAK